MSTQTFILDKIISRLKLFNYKYNLNGTTLIVNLSMLTYLKIEIGPENIQINSRVRIGIPSLPIELNFLIYSIMLYFVVWYQWAVINKGVFLLLGIFLINYVICFIKTEAMKSIIHGWIDKDMIS